MTGRRLHRSPVDDALLALPVIVTLALAWSYYSSHNLGVDFRQEYWMAGHRVLHGLSPYSLSWWHIAGGIAFPYPAATALLFLPFALIPSVASSILIVAICLLALVATLRVLDVRDWRVYAISFLWFPVISAWQTGNLTLLLGLGIALVWRYRDHPLRAGLIAAAMISLKPFVWPIAVWMIATRRYAVTAATAAFGLAINLVAWAILGTGAIESYLKDSSKVIDVLFRNGYGVIALAGRFGAGHSAGDAVMLAVAALIAGACFVAGRRGAAQKSLVLCVALMLAASPLVWNHYFALLVVPLALARPRFDAFWAAPLLLWLCPAVHVQVWEIVLAWAVTAIVLTPGLRQDTEAAVRSGSAPSSDLRAAGHLVKVHAG